jgi:hypothetical protein
MFFEGQKVHKLMPTADGQNRRPNAHGVQDSMTIAYRRNVPIAHGIEDGLATHNIPKITDDVNLVVHSSLKGSNA